MKVATVLSFAALAFTTSALDDFTAGNATDGELVHLASRGVDCGPGNGVWVMSGNFYSLVDEFCKGAEGHDISDGYMVHDTYLTELSPQGSQTKGDAGKIIFTIRNEGQRPAFHVVDWTRDCADNLRILMDSACHGDRGDTKGGSNKVGSIKYEAVIKKGDTW